MLVNRHFRSHVPCLEKWVGLCQESRECFGKTRSFQKPALEYVLGKLRQRQTSKLQ